MKRKSTKLIALLLVVLMLVAMLPTTVSAAEEITSITISGVKTPAIGEPRLTQDKLSVPADANYELEEFSCSYASLPDYKEGDSPSFRFVLKAKAGCSFAAASEISVDLGSDAPQILSVRKNSDDKLLVQTVFYLLSDSVTVKYVNDDGSNSEMESTVVPFGDTYTVPECTITPPEGQIFDCWRDYLETAHRKLYPGEKYPWGAWQLAHDESYTGEGWQFVLQANWKEAPKLTLDVRCSNGASGSLQYKWDTESGFTSRKWTENGTLDLTIPSGAEKLTVKASPADGYFINQSLTEDGTGTYADGEELAAALVSDSGATCTVTEGGKTIKIEFDNHEGAIDRYPIYVGGTQVTSANAHDVLKDGGTVVYEPDTNTLKLKDASISSGANTGIGCYGSDDIIFDLKGTNTVSAPSASFAVQTTGHLTLIGDGTLDITAENTPIQPWGGLSLEGPTLKTKGWRGIDINPDKDLNVSAGSIDVTATSTSGTGIGRCGDFIMTGGSVSVTGPGYSSISVGHTFTMTGGTLTSDNTDTTHNYPALQVKEGFTLGDSLEIKSPTDHKLGPYQHAEGYVTYNYTVLHDDGTSAKHVEIAPKAGVFSVTFDGNGGAPAKQTLSTNTSGKLDADRINSLEDPKRDGFVFKGWSDSDSATEPLDISVLEGPYTADTTLYAVWEKITYPVWVGSTQVDELNKDDVLGDGKVSYDPNSKTLKLDNPVITTTHGGDAICSESGDLTIKGSATLSASIFSRANLIIDADHLTCTRIFSYNDTEIKGGEIKVTTSSGSGIECHSGTLKISDGNVTVISTGSYGVNTGVKINGGTVSITGKTNGIYTSNYAGNECVKITGGTVTITGTDGDGIFSPSGGVTVSGEDTEVTVNGQTYAVKLKNALTINDPLAIVEPEGGEASTVTEDSKTYNIVVSEGSPAKTVVIKKPDPSADSLKLTLDIRCSNGATGKVEYRWNSETTFTTSEWTENGSLELTRPDGAKRLIVKATPAEGYFINQLQTEDGTETYTDKAELASALLSEGGASFIVNDTGKTIKIEFDNHDSGITEYPVWVQGIQVKNSNKDNVLGDGKVVFTPASGSTPHTLTLNGASIGDTTEKPAIYTMDADLLVTGSATISVTNDRSGIRMDKDESSGGTLTLENAQLTISGGSIHDAIDAYNMSIESSTVEITGFSGGIRTNDGDLTISGSTVNAACTNFGFHVDGTLTIANDITSVHAKSTSATALSAMYGKTIVLGDQLMIKTPEGGEIGTGLGELHHGQVIFESGGTTQAKEVLIVPKEVTYPVWVGGMQANSANKDDILGDGTSSAKFDPETNTLTLNNPNIKAVNEPSKTIILSTITDLTIKGTATLEHSDAVFGIGATKGLTIDGDITAKGSAYGIYIMDGLVIEGGTVLAEANSDAGIFVESGNIFIKGGDVTAKGDTGIEASMGLIEISGTGTKVKAEGSNNEGIRAAAIRITGGEVTAKNGNVGLFAWAPETDIPISITISGENTVVMADGIIAAIDAANSNIEISDGAQVTATATGAEGYGIDAFGDITISGDSTVVTADGKKSAVQAGDKIDIKDPLSIFEPADGKLDDAQRKILTSDGETATHAVIKKSTAPGGGEQTYTITWVIDGVEETETYASGEMPTHATPTKPDDAYYTYTFQKWTPAIVAVTEDATYTAVFTRTAKYTPYVPPVKPVSPFIDVAPGTTLYDDVMYLYDRGIMVGMSAHVFGPYLPLTRGMIVTILYRMEGAPDVKYGKTFSDVPDNTWYTDGVEWAASHGIVFGYGNGKYGPNDSVTREQLAAILFRYAKYKGYDVSIGENTNILSYDDVFDTSSWAIPAMQWACGSGVLEDVPVGKIRPTSPATRAEIARAIHVFLEKVAK